MHYLHIARLTLVACLIVCIHNPVQGQGWQWPETSENLQVLPDQTSADQLQQTMLSFVRSLGVRCSYCHVGEEGQPLHTYDFTSDDRPAKAKARVMMQMVQSINNEHLAELSNLGIEPDDLLRVTCQTCHRGLARPEALENVLASTLAADGVEAMRATYAELRNRYYGADAYDFGEGTLRTLGQQVFHADRPADAIAVFRLNTEFYPTSSRAVADLAEAYFATDQPEQARVFFEEALRLDPTNRPVVARLQELRN